MKEGSYRNVLKQIDFKPYRPRLVIELNEDDQDRRVEFCELMLDKFQTEPNFVHKILWTVESIFRLNGTANKHNCVYWCEENPHIRFDLKHTPQGLHVWCGMTSTMLIGPYFFEGNVTGITYLELLRNFMWPQVRDCSSTRMARCHIMHFQFDSG